MNEQWTLDKNKRINHSGNTIEYILHVWMRQNWIQSNENNITIEKFIIIDSELRSVDTKRWIHTMYVLCTVYVYTVYSIFNFCFCFTYIHTEIPWELSIIIFFLHGMTLLLTYNCLIFILFFVIINESMKFCE